MTIYSEHDRTIIDDKALADVVFEVETDPGIPDKVRGVKIAAAIEHAMQQYQRDRGYGLPMPGAPRREHAVEPVPGEPGKYAVKGLEEI